VVVVEVGDPSEGTVVAPAIDDEDGSEVAEASESSPGRHADATKSRSTASAWTVGRRADPPSDRGSVAPSEGIAHRTSASPCRDEAPSVSSLLRLAETMK
jgi:hypothetical protein